MSNVKYDNDYLIKICEEKDLSFINIESVKTGKKVRRFLYFICNKHKEKGLQSRPVEKIVINKKPCQYCNHSKLKETFVEEIANINPDIEILSDYVNWNTNIHCRCKIHKNYEWDTKPSVLLYGSGCSICGHVKTWNARGRKTTQDIIDEIKKIDDNIEIIGEYVGAHNLIKCRCKIDGTEWESYVSNLLNRSARCPSCANQHLREIEGLSQKEFIKRLNESNSNIEILDNYQNAYIPLKFKCKIHNTIFEATPRSFLYGNKKGCPYCTQTSGERKLVSILESKGFHIKQQYTFDDCKYINKLRFDAFDVENNIAYEYQGQQHYYPVDFSGQGQDWAKEQFNINKKRDEIKVVYCKENKIPLIQIPYWEFDNMENFIDKAILKYK